MIRQYATSLLLALSFLFAAWIGTADPTLSARAQAGHSPSCHNFQLTIRYVSGGAALGHVGIIYRIHDISGHPCVLQGYPGVELFNRNFRSIPTHVSRGGGYIIVGQPPKPPVTLDSRHDAYFGLEFHDVPDGNQSCPEARFLMVTPPNDYLPIIIPSGGITPCGGQVIVSPIHSNNSIQ